MKSIRQEFVESVKTADTPTLVRRFVALKRKIQKGFGLKYGSIAVKCQYLKIMRDEIRVRHQAGRFLT